MPGPSRAALPWAVFKTIGRPLFFRLAALGTVVAMGGTIVFMGNGLPARSLVGLVHTSPGVRLVLWAGWALLVTPVIAPVFDAPGTLSLRALRPRTGPLVAVILALLAIAETPWALLFAAGGGALQSVAMSALALSLHLGLAAARARPRAAGLAAA
ncbi:MAG: hypothetical protein FWD17_13215, partial [Polyangiaceae bacterium]|nr:hypothetical protein [Polyangiaceae bacterium]